MHGKGAGAFPELDSCPAGGSIGASGGEVGGQANDGNLAAKPPMCAVTVTHHPDPEWARRFDAIVRETGRTVIVDNGSEQSELRIIESHAAKCRAHLIRNSQNLGLAAALNQGVRWAFQQGFPFVLLFDQDTEPLPGIASELLRVYHLANSEAPTAVVGANYFDDKTGRVRFPSLTLDGAGWSWRTTVIASGSLIERSAFERVGGFREDFFVDSVDHEYCLRARAKGLRVALAAQPLMRHSFGDTTTHRLLWSNVSTTNHLPVRRYFIARNHLILSRQYLLSEPGWVARSLYGHLVNAVVMLCVEDCRAAKAGNALLGLLHGVFGKTEPRHGRGEIK